MNYLIIYLAMSHGLWDFSFWPGIELTPSAMKARSPNH